MHNKSFLGTSFYFFGILLKFKKKKKMAVFLKTLWEFSMQFMCGVVEDGTLLAYNLAAYSR